MHTMKTQVLPVELPRIDGDTQSRVKINEDTVSDYADIISAAGTEWPFPPLDVFYDGTDHFLGDGFHRLLGALRTKRGSVPCYVHKGTASDARIFGMTANDKHGLRMSPADKRACVEWLLDNGGKMAQKTVAMYAGVSPRTVQQVVADRKPPAPTQTGEGSSNLPIHPPESADVAPASPPTASDDDATEIPDAPSESPGMATTAPELGKCPNCGKDKWEEDEEGDFDCKACHHPHGEPAGDADDKQVKLQRKKAIGYLDYGQRAVDDLNDLKSCTKRNATIKHIQAAMQNLKDWPI